MSAGPLPPESERLRPPDSAASRSDSIPPDSAVAGGGSRALEGAPRRINMIGISLKNSFFTRAQGSGITACFDAVRVEDPTCHIVAVTPDEPYLYTYEAMTRKELWPPGTPIPRGEGTSDGTISWSPKVEIAVRHDHRALLKDIDRAAATVLRRGTQVDDPGALLAARGPAYFRMDWRAVTQNGRNPVYQAAVEEAFHLFETNKALRSDALHASRQVLEGKFGDQIPDWRNQIAVVFLLKELAFIRHTTAIFAAPPHFEFVYRYPKDCPMFRDYLAGEKYGLPAAPQVAFATVAVPPT